MSSTALTKTRIVVGTLMAAATIASAGVATSLTLAHEEQQTESVADAPIGTTDSNTSPSTKRHSADDNESTKSRTSPSTAKKTFTPAPPPAKASAPSHTKSKGS